MRKLSAVLVVLFALGLSARSQDTPRVEIFTGASFTRAAFPRSTDPAAGNGTGTLAGWNASAAVNANRWLGVVADFGGYYGSASSLETFMPKGCVLCTGNVSGTLHSIHTFTAGPQLSHREGNLTIFAHALFGGAHIREDLVSDVTPSLTISSTSFATMVGGGVDLGLSPRFAIRLQPDYLMTRILAHRHDNFRLSGGLVFRFGQ